MALILKLRLAITMLSKSKNNAYGKLLSWLLRHEPHKLSLSICEQGWVSVDALLGALKDSNDHPEISLDELGFVVDTDEKGRFSLSECSRFIRCNQGHSVPHVKGMTMSTPEELIPVYHGTSEQNYKAILESGSIKPMRRNHAHFAVCPHQAKKVGARHGKPVVLEIDTLRASEAGVCFQVSDNGVWLSDELPVQFTKVVQESAVSIALGNEFREKETVVNFALGSDFHTEEAAVFQNKKSTRLFIEDCLTFPPVPEGTQVLVLAGDICELKKLDLYRKVLEFYSALVKDIVLVCGNHEFWGSSYQSGLEKIEILKSEFPTVHFLENEEITLNGVRIFGATMWCNYNHDTYLMSELNRTYTTIKGAPLDARRIKWRNKYGGTSKGKAEHLYVLNKKSVKALTSFLDSVGENEKALVVSHFPLTPERVLPDSLAYDWAGIDLKLLEGKKGLQLAHGHLHCQSSYVNGTGQKVWLNPRGIVDVKNPDKQRERRYSLVSFSI